MIAAAILSSLGLVLLSLLRGGILSSGRTAQEVFLLSNARKALSGSGAKRGVLDDAQQASGVVSVSSSSLALLGSAGAEDDYGVSEGGQLVSAISGSSVPVAANFQGLSVSYYARTPDFRIVESSDPASVDLVVLSFGIEGKTHRLQVFSGARLMNAQ